MPASFILAEVGTAVYVWQSVYVIASSSNQGIPCLSQADSPAEPEHKVFGLASQHASSSAQCSSYWERVDWVMQQCTSLACLEVLNNLTLKDVGMFIDELENEKPVCSVSNFTGGIWWWQPLPMLWECSSLEPRAASCNYRGQAFHEPCVWALLRAWSVEMCTNLLWKKVEPFAALALLH